MQDQSSSSVTTEEICDASENGKTNILLEETITPAIRSSKSVKAGEKAPHDVIKLWKENGFSR